MGAGRPPATFVSEYHTTTKKAAIPHAGLNLSMPMASSVFKGYPVIFGNISILRVEAVDQAPGGQHAHILVPRAATALALG